jgi:hypothetical protein
MSVSLLGCWMLSSSLWIYPHSLSYFNESIGGPLNGPKHLLGSNVDWGQDMQYAMIRMLDDGRECKLQMLYLGGFFPSDVRTEFQTMTQRGVSGSSHLRVAASINSLFGDRARCRSVDETRDTSFGVISSSVNLGGSRGTYAMRVIEYFDGVHHE